MAAYRRGGCRDAATCFAQAVAAHGGTIAVASSPEAGTTFPTAYELTGSREEEIAEYVGRRVVLTGIRKEADVQPVGTSGILRPTGGFDPLANGAFMLLMLCVCAPSGIFSPAGNS